MCTSGKLTDRARGGLSSLLTLVAESFWARAEREELGAHVVCPRLRCAVVLNENGLVGET